MNGLLIAGLCLALSALLVRTLDWFIGGGRAKFTDLTRSSDYLCQRERTPNNDLARDAYARRRDALGHGAVRPARVRPEPAQLHGWEDDGGRAA